MKKLSVLSRFIINPAVTNDFVPRHISNDAHMDKRIRPRHFLCYLDLLLKLDGPTTLTLTPTHLPKPELTIRSPNQNS
jgi:hypothetical protein